MYLGVAFFACDVQGLSFVGVLFFVLWCCRALLLLTMTTMTKTPLDLLSPGRKNGSHQKSK